MDISKDERSIYSRARLTRDRNFDGRFFFAVKTTGIFCRPSCPSPAAKEENVEYFGSVFGAMESGFRPCHRCRPDLKLEYYNSFLNGEETVRKALQLIYHGFLNYHSLSELADELYISDRQLRKVFIDCLGIPPVKIGRYHKSIFAKKMLYSTDRPITEIAFAAGFRSIRQFNATYRDFFGETPRQSRKNCRCGGGEASMLLHYRQPPQFEQILNFLSPRLIPGIEAVSDGRYYRSFRTENSSGWFSVSDRPDQNALELQIGSDDIRCYMEIYYRVRKMFDLDTDFKTINSFLGADPLLRRGMRGGEVPRLPAAFDPFEFVVRAILGQQITIKAATTLAGRIAAKAAIRAPEHCPAGLSLHFPNARELSALPLDGLGITGIRQQTVKTVAGAVLGGRLSLSPAQSFDDFHRNFIALKGIGEWTVNYTAMRGLGMPDAFPAADLGIIKALGGGRTLKPREIEREAQKWSPYRTYAALCLWNIEGE